LAKNGGILKKYHRGKIEADSFAATEGRPDTERRCQLYVNFWPVHSK
jgi:hypothetical protein